MKSPLENLVHTQLAIFFDDIQAEEGTPSVAGGAAWIDFLLKTAQIGIERKMIRPGLTPKALGDALRVDSARYRAAHPDCQELVIVVADPDRRLVNPSGLDRDLSGTQAGMPVMVAEQD